MATITYKIKSGSNTIYCSVVNGRVSNDGFQLRKSTGKEIKNPKNWIKEKQEVRKCNEEPNAKYLNDFIVKHKASITKGIDELTRDERPINKANVIQIINGINNSVQSKRDTNAFSITEHLADFVELMKSGKKLYKGEVYAKNTMATYKSLIANLTEFEKAKGIIKPHLVDNKLYAEMLSFFRDEAEVEYSENYVGSIIKRFKALINLYLIADLGISFPKFIPSLWIRPSNESVSTYLTLQQINTLLKLDLSGYEKEYDNVRDTYCFIALTCGIRIGDYMRLDKHNITTKMVNGKKESDLLFRQSKVGAKVKAPIGNTSLAIIKKHNGFPKIISARKSNLILCEIGKLCGFDTLIPREDKKGNLIEEIEQYKLMQNHSARRSFCTNAWSCGTDLIQIMKISGHKTPNVLLKYIDKTLDEYADGMRDTSYHNKVNELDNSVKLKAV